MLFLQSEFETSDMKSTLKYPLESDIAFSFTFVQRKHTL